jgi:hypothetical protein
MKKIFTFVLAALVLTSCASMDLRVDTMPTSSLYGSIPPRISADKCKYIPKESAPDPSTYTVLAQYIIQENPTVITALSANEMLRYGCEIAVEKGADAIIVDEMSTTSVAGRAARTSPVVKLRAIRFKGEIPQGIR